MRAETMDCYQCILLYWFLYVPGNSCESWSLYVADCESLSEKNPILERSRGKRGDILRMRHFVMFFSTI